MKKQTKISVIIACKNVGCYVEQCLASVLEQTHLALEVIVVDDGSTDDTRAVISKCVSQDGRVRLLNGPGRGPAAARNAGLLEAQGEWIAIVDGDDLIHPERLKRLLDSATESGADVIGDGLMAFVESDTSRTAWPFFLEAFHPDGEIVGMERLFSRSKDGIESPLGYIKPLIRKKFLSSTGVRYDEELFIGEDFDFLARLLASGAKMIIMPVPLYFYRRHSGSISHRLSDTDAQKMLTAAEIFYDDYQSQLSPRIKSRVLSRLERLRLEKNTQDLIHALKGMAYIRSLHIAVTRPAALFRTVYYFIEGLVRRLRNVLPSSKNGISSEVLSANKKYALDHTAAEEIGTKAAIAWACHLFASSLGVNPNSSMTDTEAYWTGFWRSNPTFAKPTDIKGSVGN